MALAVASAVGVALGSAGPDGPALGALLPVTRAGIITGFAVMVGVSLLPPLLGPDEGDAPVWAAARRLGLLGAGLAVGSSIGHLLARVDQIAPGAGLRPVLVLRYVATFTVGKALVAAAMAGLAYLILAGRRGFLPRRDAAAGIMIAFVGVLPVSLSGHASHVEADFGGPMVLAMAGHVLGAMCWVGVLTVLAAVLRGYPSALARTLPRYSRFAGGCAALVALTGSLSAAVILTAEAGAETSWTEVLTDPYGLLVLAKLAGLLIVVALGARIRFTFLPGLREGRVGTTVRWILVEVAAMGAVFGIAALLAGASPTL
ncbi:MAG: copper resistance D family protein [Pseudonocardia sp.]